ncbi:MAG: carboxylating nicotinate-nucleotide diphosphorylase [Xanthobacteraceae bacterium]|nr:MAG: carboxylating nicotinate-nucleotide diphosphorylase [Xanthobacteraceae bacterium]
MSPDADIATTVRAALQEDIGSGDFTSMLVSADSRAWATVVSRETAVLCGNQWFEHCFHELDSEAEVHWLAQEGELVGAGQVLCEIKGNARALLTAERTALNFLQTLSATATATRHYVEATTGTRARLYDTRKTLPGLRAAQKYAVRVGGGFNHRMGLSAGILIKENHIAVAGGIAQALHAAEQIAPPGVWVQIEVENCDELIAALAAGAKLILLDNFSIVQMHEAVAITDRRAELEASGGITLANLREIAETGIDRISIGSITKDVKAVDLSMRITCESQMDNEGWGSACRSDSSLMY